MLLCHSLLKYIIWNLTESKICINGAAALKHKERKTDIPVKGVRTKCLGYTIATEDLPLSGRDFEKGKLA